jgi:hypothetical protein
MRSLAMATLVIASLSLGCASSGSTSAPPATTSAAPQTTEQAAAPTDVLHPSAAELEASEVAVLTGTELGSMWTFENAPRAYWAETYGFEATDPWMEHVRLASVRFGGGCSSSFISPNGLVMTNHHCARSCVDALSDMENDYLVNGFKADTRDEELVCPNLFLDQLIEIVSVTDEVRAAGAQATTEAEIAEARTAARETIVERCEAESDFECQVVSLYHGGQYQLYKYNRFQPVKLVFAPEHQAGSFGGDPDNFTYPRYALDVAFVRAYEADGVTPAATPHYFKWDPNGADEGELVFITGNPGSTQRQATVTQLLYEQQARHPVLAEFLTSRLDVLHALAETSEEMNMELRGTILGYENGQKLYIGELGGLLDPMLIGRKIKWENEFKAAVNADPTLQAEYGDVWNRIAVVATEKAELYPSLVLNNPASLYGAPYMVTALQLIRYGEAMALPEDQRPENLQGDALAETQIELRADSPDALMSRPLLASRLEIASMWLDPSSPLRAAMNGSDDFGTVASRLVDGSRIGDEAFRSSIVDGGADGLAAAKDDPIIALATAMLAEQRKVASRWAELAATETVLNEKLAGALFEVYGTDIPPDATFTLRISDGVVKRYPYNGTYAPAFTTIHGLYARNLEFEDGSPWNMAPSWQAAAGRVDMTTRYNFVSTNDITGGNSGSPMIDADANLVGIAFDGNIEQLPNQFLFSTETGRTVAVHSAGILEALRSVYDAQALLSEILGES